MQWINYHHLLYFWTVAREGNMSRAAELLHLTPQTISGQLKNLEKSVGEPLLERTGRGMVLTEAGKLVFSYADEIFSLGQELSDAIRYGRQTGPLKFVVGVADVVPKLIAYRILQPVLRQEESVRLICREGAPDRLLADLAMHEIDLVITDRPVGQDSNVRAYNHPLGTSGISFFGVPELAAKYGQDFPSSLNDAPFLLPTFETALRRSLDFWFDDVDVRPVVVGEFSDSALLKAFSQRGAGLFVASTVIESEICDQYRVEVIGRTEAVQEHFYAISVNRKLQHPSVVAICETARNEIFHMGE